MNKAELKGLENMKSRIGALSLLMFFCALGVMQKGNAAEHEHEHEKGGSAKIPDTYSKAVNAIEHHGEAIAKLIATGKLADLHHEGESLKKIAEQLPRLASKEDSGIAKSDIREINLTSKELAAKYGPLDEAGDAGKKEESQKVYNEMVPLIEKLKKFSKGGEHKH